jgi:hypothetical protein
MTTPINSNSHIVINMPKSKQKQPPKISGCYEENRKEMQVAKIQEILVRHRQQRNSVK